MKLSAQDLQNAESDERKIYDKARQKANCKPHRIKGNFLSFFGRQHRLFFKGDKGFRPVYGGFYVKHNNLEMLVDPGANLLSRSQNSGINLYRLNTIFISHSHIDHANDANVAMEIASCNPDETTLLISKEAINQEAVKRYHLNENKKLKLKVNQFSDQTIRLSKNISITPIRVFHSIEGTYGFVLDIDGFKIGYTADTGFTKTFSTTMGEYKNAEDYTGEIIGPKDFDEDLKNIFSGVDLLIFNLHSFSYNKRSQFHSTVFDLVEILKDSKIKLCICDHLYPGGSHSMKLSSKIIKFAKQETGKNILLVGSDGLKINLDRII